MIVIVSVVFAYSVNVVVLLISPSGSHPFDEKVIFDSLLPILYTKIMGLEQSSCKIEKFCMLHKEEIT